MTEFTPYAPPTPHPESAATLKGLVRRFPAKRLWLGYLVAPVVAPIFAAALVVFFYVYSYASQSTGSVMGMTTVPLALLTVGVFLSYVVMLILGMPLIFFLNRTNRLSGLNLHLASIAASFALTCVAIVLSLVTGDSSELFKIAYDFGATFIFFTPLALVTATTFWFVACRKPHSQAYEEGHELQQ